MKIVRTICALLLVAVLALCLCGCETQYGEQTLFAMDTVITIKVYGDSSALSAAVGLVKKYDALFSPTNEQGDVYKINAGAGSVVEVSKETLKLLILAGEYSRQTGGAFDPSVGALVELWGFRGDTPAVPTAAAIKALLPFVSRSSVVIHDTGAAVAEGAAIDLGGIAKGFLCDEIADTLYGMGVRSALISAGGNIQALGSRPDGSMWRIAVTDPFDPSARIGVLKVSDRAVVTSGGYNRYFNENGVRYSHILDPKTGYPADSGIASVTIVSSDGTSADAYSTALYVMGAADAVAFWREHGSFDMIIVTNDRRILITHGIADLFEFRYTSGYEHTVIY